jgi:hypothetical protein
MGGITRELVLDVKHVAKHLPGTPQMLNLLQKEGNVHLFNDKATMQRVATDIMAGGEFTGTVRGHDRYGLYFAEPIGYRLDQDGNSKPLYYAEMKVKGDRYHVIPRTNPS